MKNTRFANAQHRGVLLDYDDDSGTLFVDSGPLLARVAAGEFGPIAPFVPHVLEQPTMDALAKAKLAAIQEGKNTARDAGFVHDGVLFDSDSGARLAYLEFATKLGMDSLYSTPWKASSGVWVTMDATLFAALQPAYEAHISTCFAWQAAREQEVAAALILAETDEAAGRAALAAVSELLEF